MNNFFQKIDITYRILFFIGLVIILVVSVSFYQEYVWENYDHRYTITIKSRRASGDKSTSYKRQVKMEYIVNKKSYYHYILLENSGWTWDNKYLIEFSVYDPSISKSHGEIQPPFPNIPANGWASMDKLRASQDSIVSAICESKRLQIQDE